jgi:hypothetical protein
MLGYFPNLFGRIAVTPFTRGGGAAAAGLGIGARFDELQSAHYLQKRQDPGHLDAGRFSRNFD